MGSRRHPNFNAVEFVLTIVDAYYKNLRGKATYKNAPGIKDLVSTFALTVEERVDNAVYNPPSINHIGTD